MGTIDKLFVNNADSIDPGTDFSIEAHINVIDAMARISNQSAFIIDFDRHSLIYRTPKLLYIDEVRDTDNLRNCANPYWSLVSEDTLNSLLAIRNNYLLIGNEINAEDYSAHVCLVDYPIVVNNRKVFITQRFTPVEMRNDGITKIGMFIIGYSNKCHLGCRILLQDGRQFKFNFLENHFSECEKAFTLSSTEKAVMARLRMGLSTWNAAQSLCVSNNTIKTHRSHIFSKLDVSSITEAIAVADNFSL